MSNKKIKQKKKVNEKELESLVKELFKANPTTLYTMKALSSQLNGRVDKNNLKEIVNRLHKEEYLYSPISRKYRLDRKIQERIAPPSDQNTIKGKVDRTRSGSAYIVPIKEKMNDVFVSEKNLGSAMHGDIVEVRVLSTRRKRPEGEVTSVVERKTEHFVGKFLLHKNRSIVEVDDGKSQFDVWVNANDSMRAENEDIVIVHISKWPTRTGQAPLGMITEILGKAGSNESEMKSIVIKNGFDLSFPDVVLEESEKLSNKISKKEEEERRDVRSITTFTIDPDTAKDFDDALSLEILSDGSYEVGVHIADVSYYVRPDSALDSEAAERTTSVYLVDRVIPMLPERLSNELCSLRPDEDKLTFSAIFTFNKKHQITKRWFGRTIIHSDRRFTYEEAQDVIDSGEGDFVFEVQFLNGVANRLRKERFKKGSINFETDEVKFVLDEDAHPIDIVLKERKPAHMLVEDLMLLANREVAEFIVEKEKNTSRIPFVYRVHDKPDMEKVEEFVMFAKGVGYNFDIQNPDQIVQAYNKLSTHAHQNEAFKLLQPLAIRTMAKAIYTPDNIGHFGLGFSNYTHFTSPIRRYADVLVHRILEKNIHHTYRYDLDKLESLCVHISNQERSAMDAERESIRYKQAEFIKDKIGMEMSGVVSGMIDRGFFVQLFGSHAEGLVDFSSLDEKFDRNDSAYKAVGRRSGDVIQMGTNVIVRIVEVNMSRKEIDMKLVSIQV